MNRDPFNMLEEAKRREDIERSSHQGGSNDPAPPVSKELRYAKVTSLLMEDGSSWSSFAVSKTWPCYVAAYPSSDSVGTVIDTVPANDLHIVINQEQAVPVGYVTQTTKIIAYMPLDGQLLMGGVVMDGIALANFGTWIDFVPLIDTDEWSGL